MDELLAILGGGGGHAYRGEPVTVIEHSLQSAALAEADGAPGALVAAALLHDLGWLVTGRGGHQARGAARLATVLGPEVAEPVRLHVAAKRYRCTIEPAYREALTTMSRRTLRAQGGVMDDPERRAFEAEAFGAEALRLRGYDDRAKVPGAPTPDLAHYAAVLARLT